MLYQIQSETLIVQIDDLGAELCSVKSRSNQMEWIWQADPQIWNRHAPVLFPIVGKLNQNRIQIEDKQFEMSQHGFARDSRFEPIEVYGDLLKLMLVSDDVSLGKYPYEFRFFITYQLLESTLEITYTVQNADHKKMYFSVGAHPGFLLPNAQLDQYYLEFEKEENPDRYMLTDGLLNGEKESMGLLKQINLNSELFQKDALVFKNLKSSRIQLKHRQSDYCIGMGFADFPYFGIWTKPGQENFICLEPWLGVADTIGFQGDISQKEGILSLEPGTETSYRYTIEFGH